MSRKKVLILTGESSGELYGALLAKEILRRWPEAEIWGIGGERMAQRGVRLLGNLGHAFGLIEAIGAIRNIKANFNAVIGHIKENKPQVLVLIDYPDFNIRIGEIAKSQGIKVIYYVSPQVWAWRKKRRFKIRDISDYIALILPFEESLYREIGARAEFVGHPAMEEIEDVETLLSNSSNSGYKTGAKELLGIETERPAISLLPGSRPSELKRLLPLIKQTSLKMMELLKEDRPVFLMPLAPNLPEDFKKDFDEINSLGVKVLPPFISLDTQGQRLQLSSSVVSLMASEIAIAASGTVVLQAGLIGTPTIVIYRLSGLTYFIGRLIVDVKYITIPNIILDKEVYPELLQKKANSVSIISHALRFLREQELRDLISRELLRLREIFSNKRPSKRVAEIAGELAEW